MLSVNYNCDALNRLVLAGACLLIATPGGQSVKALRIIAVKYVEKRVGVMTHP